MILKEFKNYRFIITKKRIRTKLNTDNPCARLVNKTKLKRTMNGRKKHLQDAITEYKSSKNDGQRSSEYGPTLQEQKDYK